MLAMILSCLREEGGVTAIEYGLIAAVVAGAIVTALSSVGPALNTGLTQIADAL